MQRLYLYFIFSVLSLALLGFLYLSLGHLPQQEYLMRMIFEEKAQQVLQEYKKQYEDIFVAKAKEFLRLLQNKNMETFKVVENNDWVWSTFFVENSGRIVYPKIHQILVEEKESILPEDTDVLYQKGYRQEFFEKQYDAAMHFYKLALSQVTYPVWQIRLKLRIGFCLEKMGKQEEARQILEHIVEDYKASLSYWYLVAHYRYGLLCEKEKQELVFLDILQQLVERKFYLPRLAQYEYWVKILKNILPSSKRRNTLLLFWEKSTSHDNLAKIIGDLDWSLVQRKPEIHWHFDASSSWLVAYLYKSDMEGFCGVVLSPKKIIPVFQETHSLNDYFVTILWNDTQDASAIVIDSIFNTQVKICVLPKDKNQLANMIYQEKIFIVVLTIVVFFVLVIGLATSFYNYYKAVRYSRLQNDFVACISHEIRTPLALIHSFSETLLLKRIPNEKHDHYHRIIVRETQRLTKLIENVLHVSQIELRQICLSPQQVNIRNIVNNWIENRNWYWGQYNGNIINNIADTSYFVDESAITTILFNLIDNAVKYTPNDKDIYITSGENNEHWFIAVRDQGMGIPKKEQKKIFDKFYQINKKGKGVGLGLLIVHLFCVAHNGRVTLQSKVDEGSTFTVSFDKKA